MILDSARLANAVAARRPFAEDLFETVRDKTRDRNGVTRPAWSEQDQCAAELLAEAARSLCLEVRFDPAGNLLCTLPGRNRTAPGLLTGSHLDSVPVGGHYDGLAGVVAGLVVAAALRDLEHTPGIDLTTIGIRGEESVWFGIAYVGSRLAVGALPLADLDRRRRGDSGSTLAEHMRAVGVDVPRLRQASAPWIGPLKTKAFLELHIEQGPVLVGEKVSVAVPTTIRGNVRYPYARCSGRYDHSAAAPRAYRQDAALAVVELVRALDEFWMTEEAAGTPDTVFTVGKLFTDAAHHAMTKVPGRCDFTLNFGGTTAAFLAACRATTGTLVERLEAERGVKFELGECVGSEPTPLDPHLRGVLAASAAELEVPILEMATVGHDASVFARAGIPAAMVLVRNANGSHNPEEAMAMSDFLEGTQVLAGAITELAVE